MSDDLQTQSAGFKCRVSLLTLAVAGAFGLMTAPAGAADQQPTLSEPVAAGDWFAARNQESDGNYDINVFDQLVTGAGERTLNVEKSFSQTDFEAVKALDGFGEFAVVRLFCFVHPLDGGRPACGEMPRRGRGERFTRRVYLEGFILIYTALRDLQCWGCGICRKRDSLLWRNGFVGTMRILPINMFCWSASPMLGSSLLRLPQQAGILFSSKTRKEITPMVPISIEKFADMVMKSNEGYNRKELVEALQAALDARNYGAKCMICGQPIWAAGSAITGTNMCFTCTTGETDDSEDYEIY